MGNLTGIFPRMFPVIYIPLLFFLMSIFIFAFLFTKTFSSLFTLKQYCHQFIGEGFQICLNRILRRKHSCKYILLGNSQINGLIYVFMMSATQSPDLGMSGLENLIYNNNNSQKALPGSAWILYFVLLWESTVL